MGMQFKRNPPFKSFFMGLIPLVAKNWILKIFLEHFRGITVLLRAQVYLKMALFELQRFRN